jgi:type IX secretion system PorP/SprF family membrane protein
MRKIILILLIVSASTFSYAQQLPHYSLYMLNEVVINPAALSKEKDNKLTLMLRDQWSSFEGAPTTQSISYNHLNHHKYKKGISIINDVTGPISNISATVSGSYSILIQDENKIALGASATIMQYKIDNSQITLEDDGVFDPTLYGGVDKANGTSLAIGAYYYNSDYFIGLSVPNIIGSPLNVSNNINANKLENHYYLNGGANINLENNNKIIPSVMIKKVGALPIQIDFNLRGVYHDLLWAGISYRTRDAFVALFGVDYGQSSFGYSYDITTSAIRVPSAGTHGLLYSYRFKSKQKDRDGDGVLDVVDDCPKIPGLLDLNGCPDKDKDGIKDNEDECPDEFGLKINNGCPDKDGDGIVDKKDECPEVPGLAIFKGCPDTDGDGLQDKYDNCPKERGPIINHGCPKGASNVDTVYITVTDTVYITINNQSELKQAFKDVKFESDKYILTSPSKLVLNEVSNFMGKNDLEIYLIGHTDAQALDNYNLVLSENRVKAVQKYLVDLGIMKTRIKIDWKGETEPIAPNNTENGREKNRRVELIILKNE